MSAAVSGVPAEAIEAAARRIFAADHRGSYDRWGITSERIQNSYRAVAESALAAALPSLREQIAAEVLGPLLTLTDQRIRNLGHAIDLAQSEARFRSRGEDERDAAARAAIGWVLAAIAAPVQAAEGCPEWCSGGHDPICTPVWGSCVLPAHHDGGHSQTPRPTAEEVAVDE